MQTLVFLLSDIYLILTSLNSQNMHSRSGPEHAGKKHPPHTGTYIHILMLMTLSLLIENSVHGIRQEWEAASPLFKWKLSHHNKSPQKNKSLVQPSDLINLQAL